MPAQLKYPGVYVEELTSPVHPIVGVSTSITAFVGTASRGPVGKAIECLSYADYERHFGGLDGSSEMSYAVYQFFASGGGDALVTRVAAKAVTAKVNLKAGNNDVLTFESLFMGKSANFISLQVEAAADGAMFDLTVRYLDPSDPGDAVTEVFNALSMDSTDGNYVVSVINDPDTGSKLVKVVSLLDRNPNLKTKVTNAGSITSQALLTTDQNNQPAPIDPSQLIGPGQDSLTLVINGVGVVLDSLMPAAAQPAGAQPDPAVKLKVLCTAIQNGVKAAAGTPANPALAKFGCTADPAKGIVTLTSGAGGADSAIVASGPIASALGLGYNNGGTSSPGAAQLNPSVTDKKGIALAGGDDHPLDPKGNLGEYFEGYIGDAVKRSGLYALEEVDLFNILCIPGITDPAVPACTAILQAAAAYCEQRRAFLIIDSPKPQDGTPTTPAQMLQIYNGPILPRSDHAAVYYPWVKLPDPLQSGRNRFTAPCGIVAGIFARTDIKRGVWKAPAGIETSISGATGLEYRLTDMENGLLNPKGINCLRNFPVYNNIIWGARTLRGADEFGSQYKYVPVRRFALFLEESLFRGLKWVVFEPNDEPLWSSIRLNVRAFMHDLFVQGAFEGSSPRDAYRVVCDSSTTSQNDIDKGIVNIVVAFAPLKPAEFVVLKIQQLAGQIQT